MIWGTLTTVLLVFAGRRCLARWWVYWQPRCTRFAGLHHDGQFRPLSVAAAIHDAAQRILSLESDRDTRRSTAVTFGWRTFAFLGVYMSWQAAVFLGVGMAIATLIDRRGRLSTVFGCDTLVESGRRGRVCDPRSIAQAQLVDTVRPAGIRHGRQRNARCRCGVRPTSSSGGLCGNPPGRRTRSCPWRPYCRPLYVTLRDAWQRATQTLIIILLATAWPLALLLPITAGRYAYFLAPIASLLAAIAVVAAARAARLVVGSTPRRPCGECTATRSPPW